MRRDEPKDSAPEVLGRLGVATQVDEQALVLQGWIGSQPVEEAPEEGKGLCVAEHREEADVHREGHVLWPGTKGWCKQNYKGMEKGRKLNGEAENCLNVATVRHTCAVMLRWPCLAALLTWCTETRRSASRPVTTVAALDFEAAA